jgi:hypothetical protein
MGRRGGELAKRGGRIIQWCLEKLLLDHRAWSPVQEYWWPNEMKETGPFSCRENIMWTGAKARHLHPGFARKISFTTTGSGQA